MNRAIQIGKLLALLALAAFLLALTFWILQLRENIDELTDSWLGLAGRVNLVLDHAVPIEDASLARVKELQAPIAKAGAVEDAALARVNEVAPVLDSAKQLLVHAMPVEDAALARVQELKAPVHQFNELVLDARRGTDNVNKAAIDERFYFEKQAPETMARVNAAIDGLLPVEKNTASTMLHLSGTTADVQTAVHAYLHPSWASRVAGYVTTAAHAAVNWFGL